MSKQYEKCLAVILLAAAVLVAGNHWLIKNDDAWDWINPLMALFGGILIGMLETRGKNSRHEKIIKYMAFTGLAAMIANLAVLNITLLWHPIDALVAASFAWYAYRQLRVG
ncbi:MAG: hypothetical protein OD817_04165 [Gammaproteobacteria bacterium]